MCGDSNVMLMTCRVCVYLIAQYTSVSNRGKCDKISFWMYCQITWYYFCIRIWDVTYAIFITQLMEYDISIDGLLYKNKATIKMVWRLDNFEHLIIIQNKMDSRLRYLLFYALWMDTSGNRISLRTLNVVLKL